MKTHKNKWNIICGDILETRVRKANLDGLVTSWDRSLWRTFDNCDLDKKGRIFVFWQYAKIHLHAEVVSDQFIHCLLDIVMGSVRDMLLSYMLIIPWIRDIKYD